jgi:polysaccharide export outer membrane protein
MIYDRMHIQSRQRMFYPVFFCRQFFRKLNQSRIGCVFAAFVLLSCGGCKTSSNTPLPDQPIATTPVTLSPGDVIKLTFPAAADLNQSQKIRADGKVSLPLVGEVTAAGKKLLDFQNELTSLYKAQLRNSDVVVALESGTATVVVSGYVNKPGKLLFDRPTTVFQAIMEAGGVSEYGSLSNVHLVRIINGQQHTQVLNIRDAMSGKITTVNYVKDGDVVYVAHSLF